MTSPDTPEDLPVHQHRRGLPRTRAALDAGRLTVGYVGGSITDGRPLHNWPEYVSAGLVERFPAARLVVENAAIGATGSDLAVFRAERDLIEPGCDLVFVEFAVNDLATPTARRRQTREGLVRKLTAEGGRDLVFVYTFSQPMYEDMRAGQVPASIAEFEDLAEHYGIGSVWMGLHALRQVRRGLLRWEEWLPDGLHPQNLGSSVYAEAVLAFLDRELGEQPSPGSVPAGADRPAPLEPRHWEAARRLPFDQLHTTGPWSLQRCVHNPWIDQELCTAAPGATLRFRGRGRVLVLGLDYGKLSADLRWRLDDGPWQEVRGERPEWCAAQGWFRPLVLSDDLDGEEHECTVEVLHPGEARTAANLRVAFVGLVD
jgi:lysophospholipase L1-like esterase